MLRPRAATLKQWKLCFRERESEREREGEGEGEGDGGRALVKYEVNTLVVTTPRRWQNTAHPHLRHFH